MTKNLRNGLIGEWFCNGLKDTSGSGNDLTLAGDAAISTGKSNIPDTSYAVTNGGNGYLIVGGTPADYKLTNNFTISMWWKGTESWGLLGQTTDLNSGQYTGVFVDNWSGATPTDIRFLCCTSSSAAYILYGLIDIQDSEWHHVVFIKSSTTGMSIYVDGVRTNYNASYTANVYYDATTPYLYFGAYNNDGVITANNTGSFQNIKYWNRELSSIEINQDYNNVKENYQGLFDGLTHGWDLKGDTKDWNGTNNLTAYNSPTLTTNRFGEVDSAYDLNGTNQYFGFTTVTITGAFTYSSWWNGDNLNMFLTGLAGDNDNYIGIKDADEYQCQGITGGQYKYYTVPTMSTGTWYHVVITRDASNNVRVYHNGVESSSGAQSITAAMSMNIFGRYSSTATYANGRISDILLWNGTALSGDQAKLLYDLSSKKSIYPYIAGGIK